MSIKLILSDIDGTLLPRGGDLVDSCVIEAFHAALDAGLYVGPASGRALPAILPAFGGDAACVRTALATNGMQVYAAGDLVHEEYLDRSGLLALVDAVDAVREVHRAGVICFQGPQVYLVCGERDVLAPIFPSYAKSPIICSSLPDFPIVKANVFIDADAAGTQRFMEELMAQVPALGLNTPMPGFMNVVPVGYSKATGIQIICSHLGIDLSEVVVFGDADNDLEMLEAVPNSVAVANATPAAAAAARWHIGSVGEAAVPAAIAQIARGAFPFTS